MHATATTTNRERSFACARTSGGASSGGTGNPVFYGGCGCCPICGITTFEQPGDLADCLSEDRDLLPSRFIFLRQGF